MAKLSIDMRKLFRASIPEYQILWFEQHSSSARTVTIWRCHRILAIHTATQRDRHNRPYYIPAHLDGCSPSFRL